MLQRIVPTVARILGVCAFISITMYSVYLNSVPDCTIVCYGCATGADCVCHATEDVNLWGMIQKLNGVTLLAYLLLYVLLCYAIAIVIERWLTYYHAERQTQEFRSKVADAIYGKRIGEAKRLAAEFPKSPLAAVVNASFRPAAGLDEWVTADVVPSMEARQQAIVTKTEELRRSLWTLSAIGWTVPLVGLFILVVSLITSQQGWLYSEGSVYYYSSFLPRCLGGSLWATVFSILFAVPLIWFYKSFAVKSERLTMQLDRLSLAIIGQIVNPPEAITSAAAIHLYDTRPLDVKITRRLGD
jgi:biopolymer transport protein ExbB/TolQ